MSTRRWATLCPALVSAVGVVVLADAATEHDGVTRLDPHVAAEVLQDRSPALTTAAHLLTFLGSEVVVGVLGIVLMIALFLRGRVLQSAAVAVAMAGSAAWILVLKAVVARARPGAADRLGPVDHSFSFPSGHTLDSAVLLGLVLLFVVPGIRGRAPRWLAAAAALALAIGVGLSRVYLGYHWATDVTASWLLAFAWLALVHLTYELVARHLGGVEVWLIAQRRRLAEVGHRR